ncbi:MAG: hypothetical protein GQ569_01195 [Methylococcaceae bacterium]|nr:hypothetical protein [Methylococcaceae bacterium]
MINSPQNQHSLTTEAIVLVPGLAFGGIELFLLASRLRKLGYLVTVFYHWPFCGNFDDKNKKLTSLLKKIDSPVIHFLGCSMGGLIVLDFLTRNPNLPEGKVVLLGSPINGSLAACKVLKLPLGGFLVGKCLASRCCGKTLAFPNNREIGGITGSRNFMLSKLLNLPLPNDGLITVAETQHPNMTDSSIFEVSHYNMIFSAKIVEAVHSFFHTGTFKDL